MKAHTRNGMPETSFEAADSVTRITEKQEAILRVFKGVLSEATDEELIASYREEQQNWGLRVNQSDSGIRSRRSELVRLGLIIDSGKRETLSSGRKAIVWRLK